MSEGRESPLQHAEENLPYFLAIAFPNDSILHTKKNSHAGVLLAL